MKKKIKILIVEDDIALRNILEKLLIKNNYEVIVSNSVREGFKLFKELKPDIILSDLMLDDGNGKELLNKVRKIEKQISFIIMTAFGSISNAVEFLKLGAYDYITKPIDMDKLLKILSNLEEVISLRKEVKLLKKQENINAHTIIGNSQQMLKIKEIINQIKDLDTTILLTGETGVGKEIIAKNIHYSGNRANEVFVSINCAAIPSTLMESELFGAEKGAYTGANTKIIGKFEYAKNGTIFLDEISEMDISLQSKLLRVLQEKSFYRLGGNELITTDVRIIAATNKNIINLIKEGSFREDLFYRLNVLPINIPPLRERKEDIPIIAQFFLENINIKYKKEKFFSHKALDLLMTYSWPGNIRELSNAIERAFIFSTDMEIGENDFYFLFDTSINQYDVNTDLWYIPIARTMEEYEKIIIKKTLEYCNNNKSKAAKTLGISERSLYYKIKNYEKVA